VQQSPKSRRNRLIEAALCVVCVAAMSSPMPSLRAAGAAPQKAARQAAPLKKKVPEKRYEEYQVAAGTTLPIELRTRLSSAAVRRGDHLEGRLLRAIVAGDVELVPAGATVLGTISQVEGPRPKEPARLAFTFHVIEHPATGSRATIRAAERVFASQRPPKSKVFPDVELEKGTDASVLLLAPLVVRLPVESEN
jgi:hypothetical protein